MQLRGIGAELDEAARARLRGAFDEVYVLDGDDAHLLPDLSLSLAPEQVAVVLVRRVPEDAGVGSCWVSLPIPREWLPGLTAPQSEDDETLLAQLHATAEDSWAFRVQGRIHQSAWAGQPDGARMAAETGA